MKIDEIQCIRRFIEIFYLPVSGTKWSVTIRNGSPSIDQDEDSEDEDDEKDKKDKNDDAFL